MRAAAAESDPLWRLPLWRPYASLLDSKVADLNNVGTGGQAGAITAALFLRRFANTKAWVHFDIFAWTPAAKPGRPEGAECQSARPPHQFPAPRYVCPMAPLDPRIIPSRPEIAASHLRGHVEAKRFVEGPRHQIIEPVTALRRAPSHDARLDTEALLGE